MGDSRAVPGFGEIDLEIESDPNGSLRPPAGFGHVDLEISPPSSDQLIEEPAPPPSTSRVFGPEKHSRVTRKNMEHDESTRIVHGDALAALTRSAAMPEEPPKSTRKSPLADDGSTRAWADVDEALLSFGERDVEPAP